MSVGPSPYVRDEEVIARAVRRVRVTVGVVWVLVGVLAVAVVGAVILPDTLWATAIAALLVGVAVEIGTAVRAKVELRTLRACPRCRTLAGAAMAAGDGRQACTAGGHLPDAASGPAAGSTVDPS